MLFPRPTIVLIHGAWHGPWTWDLVAPRLRAAGFDVVTPQLPSAGEIQEPPVATHLTDVKHVQSLLRSLVHEQHKDILMVAHSYGGLVMTDSVEGFEKKSRDGGRANGVIGALYVAAFAPPRGRSIADMPTPRLGSFQPVAPGSPYMTLKEDVVSWMYQCTPVEVAKPFLARLTHQSGHVSLTKSVSSACEYVPTTYVHCTEDLAIPLPAQEIMVEEMRQTAKYPLATYRLKTDHAPQANKVDELVWIIQRAALGEVIVPGA